MCFVGSWRWKQRNPWTIFNISISSRKLSIASKAKTNLLIKIAGLLLKLWFFSKDIWPPTLGRLSNWPFFCPVPCRVGFLSLAACLCLAKAPGKHSQCHSPPSSLVNFRTSKDMLCLSLMFSIPDTYTNVFNAHFLCLHVAVGRPNGDPVVLCFLVYVA